MVDHDGDSVDLESARPLEAALRGSLPCINCGYELQGLSIRGNCPECGILVRATILYRVDPHAEAFRPLPTPLLTAWGVALWPIGALIAVLFAWAPRVADIAAYAFGWTTRPDLHWTTLVSLAALGISFVGALGMVRPTRHGPAWTNFTAAIGLLSFVPLAWCWWRIGAVVDATSLAPYVQAGPNMQRLSLRICLGVCALVVLLGLRPNARQLVARSLVLRTGRVGRQTIYATAAAVAIAMVGDGVRMASTMVPAINQDLLAGAGTILVLVGSILTTMAIAGGALDGWRIRKAIITPSPSLGQIIEFRPANGA